MKAAVVARAGSAPAYADFHEPHPAAGEQRVAVIAAALSPVVKSRASGAHYSSSEAFPFVAGIDGVGRLDDGRRVYFLLPRAPFGSMAETTIVPSSNCVPLPDGLDDITAAAIANPGLSSWTAFRERAKLIAGETVLINGATGTSGQLAIRIARHWGAKKIIATGRNEAALRTTGADEIVVLSEDTDALDKEFKHCFAEGIDVVLDYLWGRSAERLLIAAAKFAAEGVPIRFVQIGHSSGSNISLSAMTLRSAALELTGTGLGSVALPRILETVDELFRAAVSNRFEIPTRPVPLSQVDQMWSSSTNPPRTVFTVPAKA